MKTKGEFSVGTVVLVLGTSSAGKGVIIKELKKQDKLKQKGERLEWQEDGLDAELRKHSLYDKHLGILKEEQDFKDLDPKLDETQVLESVWNGGFKIGGQTTILLDAAKDECKNEIPPDEAHKYNPTNIEKLQNLATKHYDTFKAENAQRPPFTKMLENIFDRAIENSKKGLSSVIDSVAFVGLEKDFATMFSEHMVRQNVSCPVIVALAHCDINKIVEHMDKRNADAVLGERRDGFYPFRHYGETYKVAQEGEVLVGEFTINDIMAAANKYGEKDKGFLDIGGSLENSSEAQDLLKKLGVVEGHPLDQPIKVTARIKYDELYQTDPKNTERENGESKNESPESIIKIAELINSLVANHSRDVNTTKDLSEEKQSFVEKLGLQKSDEKTAIFR